MALIYQQYEMSVKFIRTVVIAYPMRCPRRARRVGRLADLQGHRARDRVHFKVVVFIDGRLKGLGAGGILASLHD
jgi:hypothetical protein